MKIIMKIFRNFQKLRDQGYGESLQLVMNIRKNLDQNLKKLSQKLSKKEKLSDEELIKITSNFQNFKKFAKDLSNDFDKLSDDFDKIDKNAKKLMFPDVSNWKKWDCYDFVRFFAFS